MVGLRERYEGEIRELRNETQQDGGGRAYRWKYVVKGNEGEGTDRKGAWPFGKRRFESGDA